MEEADRLCDRVAIIDKGSIVAMDTPSLLKQEVAGDTIIMGSDQIQNLSDVLIRDNIGTICVLSGDANCEFLCRLLHPYIS